MMDVERLYKMVSTRNWYPKETYVSPQIDTNNLSCETLLICEPWLKSIGFAIYVDMCDQNDYIYDNSEYCRILINQDNDKKYFELNNINKRYHFVLQKNYVHFENLSKMKAIFICNGKVFTIKFIKLN